MRKRYRILLAVVVVAVVSVITRRVLHRDEPVYGGATLSAWLQGGLTADDNSDWMRGRVEDGSVGIAIRNMGTNAVPYLVQMARAKDSRLKRYITRLFRKQSFIRVDLDLETAFSTRRMAAFGFFALGPMGKDAVPALLELLKDQDPYVRVDAIRCLGGIGPDAKAAIPFILPFVGSNNIPYVYDVTTSSLGGIHMEPALVVPILIKDLAVTNRALYMGNKRFPYFGPTLYALGKFGEEARAAVPFILPFLSDANEANRSAATNALKKIDPEAAAKAGVK